MRKLAGGLVFAVLSLVEVTKIKGVKIDRIEREYLGVIEDSSVILDGMEVSAMLVVVLLTICEVPAFFDFELCQV